MIKNLQLNRKIELVDRGLGAEIFSGIVNGAGAIFGLVALILVIVYAANKGGKGLVLCSIFFGVALFLGHLFSCLYHSLAYNDGKRVFRYLTITMCGFFISSIITLFSFVLLKDKFYLLAGVSLGISLISAIFNTLNFEKFRYVRIIGFLLQILIGLYVAYQSLKFLPFIGFGLLTVALISYLVSFAFHIFGYQLSYLNSVGHIILVNANVFLFFTILLYLI